MFRVCSRVLREQSLHSCDVRGCVRHPVPPGTQTDLRKFCTICNACIPFNRSSVLNNISNLVTKSRTHINKGNKYEMTRRDDAKMSNCCDFSESNFFSCKTCSSIIPSDHVAKERLMRSKDWRPCRGTCTSSKA